MTDILYVFTPVFDFINRLLSVQFVLAGYHITFGMVVIWALLVTIFLKLYFAFVG